MNMDPYGSGENSERPKWYIHLADFANVLKAFIGSNYLSIAFAFSQSGLIPGIISLLLIAFVTDHCCHMIIRCKYDAIKHVTATQTVTQTVTRVTNHADICIEDNVSVDLYKKMIRNLSYGDVGKISYGKPGVVIVNFCLFITQFGFCISYFIFIGNTIQALFPFHKCQVINGTESNLCDTLTENSKMLHVLKYSTSNTTKESVMTKYHEHGGWELDKNASVINVTDISSMLFVSTAPSLKLLVLIPLPVFIGFSYVRNVRHLGAISVGANLSIFIGAVSVLAYLCANFQVSSTYKLWNWSQLPIFFGLVTGAYEGIGTIIPIESSMEGNRHNFPRFLHGSIGMLSTILAAFGILGYLKFGLATSQMININIPSSSWTALAVNICLCIGVVLTFPLQIFPVIHLLELFLFSNGAICGPKIKKNPLADDYDDGENEYNSHDDKESLLPTEPDNTAHVPVASVISAEVSTLKRNVFRMLIVGAAAGFAILFRDKFAYIAAFTGAIGSALLAYVLPCLFQLKLLGSDAPWYVRTKNISIITVSITLSIISLYYTVRNIVSGSS